MNKLASTRQYVPLSSTVAPDVHSAVLYRGVRIDHWTRLQVHCVTGAPQRFDSQDAAADYIDALLDPQPGARPAHVVGVRTDRSRAHKASTLRTLATEGETRPRAHGRWSK